MRRARGLVLVIGYKLGKGLLEIALGVAFVLAIRMGIGEDLVAIAEHLRHHARAWSIELARLVMRAARPRALWTIAVALSADGVFSLFEGWSLVRGWWWGPWLVVVATSALLPFEVVALVREPHVARAVVLAINAAIVVYLAGKSWREHRRGIRSRGSSAVR